MKIALSEFCVCLERERENEREEKARKRERERERMKGKRKQGRERERAIRCEYLGVQKREQDGRRCRSFDIIMLVLTVG